MSRTFSLVALAIVAAFISSDRPVQAAAPTTQPVPSAENTKLKKLADVLSAKLQALTLADQAATSQPYRAVPRTNVSPYFPEPGATLGQFQFNGKTVYLVGPLIARPLAYRVVHPQKPQPAGPELIRR